MSRFVLLLHECANGVPRATHCDLMLESGDTLETWALAELPRDWQSLPGIDGAIQFARSNSVTVERLADHRLAYLNYEGPVSGDRGSVRRLDAGTFSEQQESHSYTLNGQFIRGTIELQPIAGDESKWRLNFTAP
jgi:hypothetical protein